MNVSVAVISVLAIAALIFGNAIFVAAEFSLTTLDRSAVEANARRGGRRDRAIRRAHHKLSFQLSGAQLGISATTLAAGYLTDPMLAEHHRHRGDDDQRHERHDRVGHPVGYSDRVEPRVRQVGEHRIGQVSRRQCGCRDAQLSAG
ncbi:hypothetical protein A5695_18075 [Mycobacterium sp. E1747]|nr:hypothetical protein A5695_18075 [Mycobacterium sp. E1747]